MNNHNKRQKGLVLLITLATIIVAIILSAAIISMFSNQARLTNHQISRIKAYYAAKGVMNYTLEQLRKGTWVPNSGAGAANKRACFATSGCIDAGAPDYTIADDGDIKYKVQVTIFPLDGVAASTGNVTQIAVKTDYTYTP